MDNLNTHTAASLYEAFPPHEAKRLADKLAMHYTPKYGSWLNMAELEVSVLARQCLHRRLPDPDTLTRGVAAWEAARNAAGSRVIGTSPRQMRASNLTSYTPPSYLDELLNTTT